MTPFQLAQRRKRALLSRRNQSSTPFASSTSPSSSVPAATLASKASTTITKPSVKRTPFSDDPSDDDDDDDNVTTTNRKITRVTKASTLSITPTGNNEPSSFKSGNPSSSLTFERQQQDGKERQRPSQIARMLQKRREAGFEDGGGNDDELFRAQLTQCADDAGTAMYNSVPVDGFGEALLRNMGWTGPSKEEGGNDGDNEEQGLVPRPDRLGLGAKLSDSGQAPPSSRKRRRIRDTPLLSRPLKVHDENGSGSEKNGVASGVVATSGVVASSGLFVTSSVKTEEGEIK